MRKVWKISQSNNNIVTNISEKLNINPIIAKLLVNRNICNSDEAFKFLNCKLNDLYEPFKLKGIRRAVIRILKAISNKEKILVHGDYDVDGMTSVALMVKYLRRLDANIEWYIPNRLQEGYGVGESGIKYAKNKDISLVITADCGILAFKPIEEFNNMGIDVIVTDHHNPNSKLPPAYAVINPLRPDCNYPYKGLSGVGVIFKLCQALEKELGDKEDLFYLLDLVALGTVADISPMTGENKIMVKYGLKYLNKLNNIGIKALAEVAGIRGRKITCELISFVIAPRLNASGRLGMANKSLKLLITDNKNDADKIALALDKNNKTRRSIQNKTFNEAVCQVEDTIDFSTKKIILVYGKHWHSGVIGIVASKLVNKYYRPVIILCGKGELLQGSGRSVEGLHLYNIISECRQHLESFGGHDMACGVTLVRNKINDFREELDKIANKHIGFKELAPGLNIDAQLELSELNKKLVLDLEKMAPFGENNPRPIFCSLNVNLKNKPQYLKRNTMKLWVSNGDMTYKAISFGNNFSDKNLNSKSSIHVAYTPYMDRWQGREEVGLKIKDIKEAAQS